MSKRSNDPQQQVQARQQAAAAGAVGYQFSKGKIRDDGPVDPSLDPGYGGIRHSKKMTVGPNAGKSIENITILVDNTGSNWANAVKIYNDAPQFFSLLTMSGWLPADRVLNVQIAFIGDERLDSITSFQLSQHEAEGVTLDKWWENALLPGMGGGNGHESYEIPFWALVHQNDLSCWKEGRKGVLFILADELPYDELHTNDLLAIYGKIDTAATHSHNGAELSDMMRRPTSLPIPNANIPLDTLVADLKAKYDVWQICGKDSDYASVPIYIEAWKKMFGAENAGIVMDMTNISAFMAAVVARRFKVPLASLKKDLATIPGVDVQNVLALLPPSLASQALDLSHPAPTSGIQTF